jgi:hypothetical protein
MRHPSFIVVQMIEVEIDDREFATKRLAFGLKILEMINNPRNKNSFT